MNTNDWLFFRDLLNERVASLTRKYANSPLRLLLALVWWCAMKLLKISLQKTKSKFSKRLSTKRNNEKIKILWDLRGGVGDIIISTIFLKEFYKKFDDECRISICTDLQSDVVKSIFNRSHWIEQIHPKTERSNLPFQKYDIIFHVTRIPRLLYKNSDLRSYCPNLSVFVDHYQTFLQAHPKLCEPNPYYEPISTMYSLLNKRTRGNQSDIGGLLGISDKTMPIMVLEKNAFDILKVIHLDDQAYITIQRGVDVAYGNVEHVKLWSKSHYNKLIRMIHEEYPSLLIIQVGRENSNSDLAGVDIDLRGKTNFEELKAVLKQSALHIDGECGMVHLNHTLGGRSAVCFGPTSIDLFGYPENINVKAKNACPHWCEWVTDDWHKQCLRGFDVPPCMEQLTPELFFNAIRGHLHTVTNERPCTLNETKESHNPAGTIVFIGDYPDEAMLEHVRSENSVIQFSMNLTPQLIRDRAALQITAEFADILNIPMKKESCDAVFCSQTDPLSPPAMREVTRILKKGGVLKTQDGRCYTKETCLDISNVEKN